MSIQQKVQEEGLNKSDQINIPTINNMIEEKCLGGRLNIQPMNLPQDRKIQNQDFQQEYSRDPQVFVKNMREQFDKQLPNHCQEVNLQDIDIQQLQQLRASINMDCLPNRKSYRQRQNHEEEVKQQIKHNENLILQQEWRKVISGVTINQDLIDKNMEVINQRIQEFKQQSSGIMDNLLKLFASNKGNDKSEQKDSEFMGKSELQIYKNKLMILNMSNRLSKSEILNTPQHRQIANLPQLKNKTLFHLRMCERRFNMQQFLDKDMIGLVSVDLTNCNLTNQDIATLVQRCDRLPHVVTLYLNSNKFTTITLSQLNSLKLKMKYLTRIEIQNRQNAEMKLTPNSTIDILQFMYQQRLSKQHRTIVILNQWNFFDSPIDICKWMKISPLAFSNVNRINLSDNKIDDKSFSIICGLMIHFSRLRQLDLYSNNIVNISQKLLIMLDKITSGRGHPLRINLFNNNNLSQQITILSIQKVFKSNNIKNINNINGIYNNRIHKNKSTVVIQCNFELNSMQTLSQKQKKMQLQLQLHKVFMGLCYGVGQNLLRSQVKIVCDLMREIMNNKELLISKRDVQYLISNAANNISNKNYDIMVQGLINQQALTINKIIIEDYKQMFYQKCILYNQLAQVSNKTKHKNIQAITKMIIRQLQQKQLTDSQLTLLSTASENTQSNKISNSNTQNSSNNNNNNLNNQKYLTLFQFILTNNLITDQDINAQTLLYEILQEIYYQLTELSQQEEDNLSNLSQQNNLLRDNIQNIIQKYTDKSFMKKEQIQKMLLLLDQLVKKANRQFLKKYKIVIVRNNEQQIIRFVQRTIQLHHLSQIQHENSLLSRQSQFSTQSKQQQLFQNDQSEQIQEEEFYEVNQDEQNKFQ